MKLFGLASEVMEPDQALIIKEHNNHGRKEENRRTDHR